jgi:hypothetical protein
LDISQHFVQMDVYQESKPEGVHEVEDGPFLTVEKAEAEKVAVEEIEEWPDVKRHAQPEALHLQRSLVGVTEPGRLDRIWTESAAPLEFFRCELFGISGMLLDPEPDIVFFSICLDKVVAKARHRPVYVKVMIHEVVFVNMHGLSAEELQQILRVVAAVFDPGAAKDLTALDEDAIDALETAVADAPDLLGQFRGNPLIGIKSENPLAREGQVREGPSPLARMCFEGMLEYGTAIGARDVPCFIRTARIDNEDLRCPITDAAQARLQVDRFVEGQHDDRDSGCQLPIAL